MGNAQADEQTQFENDSRRIARQLWSEAAYSGARLVDGRERDGVFETEDCIHLLEATVSRSKEKALTDGKKLADLAKSYGKTFDKAIRCWFVTRDEPTADQRAAIEAYRARITALSFSQFQSKLIDTCTYLDLRENYPFGSVRDPASGTPARGLDYIPLDLVERSTGTLWTISEIRDGLLVGKRFLTLGDYGAGKSMTLREIHKELRTAHLKGKTPTFPIYLNLRDHFGQLNPAEVLERHARNIGFGSPTHLVRAWRAGYAVLLLDGFDELTTLGMQGIWKRLQDIRYRSMQVIREFVREQPSSVGIVLAGRAHFFDGSKEMRGALGASLFASELTLSEFNDEQIKRYLARNGLDARVPAWLPSRPLLVGYLAASGVLRETFGDSNVGEKSSAIATDPAHGWDFMLDKICNREAEIEAGIDGPTVRRILERLGTVCRKNRGGLGPLTTDELRRAFATVCGYEPDEKGAVLLQRLPGLGVDRPDEQTRTFLDEDFADVCRAGDVYRYILDPFNTDASVFNGAECGLGDLGIGVCVIKTIEAHQSNGKLNAVLQRAGSWTDISMLLVDLVRTAIELGYTIEAPLEIKDIYLPSLELTVKMGVCDNLRFVNCYFSKITLDAEVGSEQLPRFARCYIDELDGRSSQKDLPVGVFTEDCEFGKFSEASDTTNSITEMDLPLGTKVLLSILRKVYMRSGSGRKENALLRGLDHHSRRLVPQVLRLLQSEGLISPYNRAGMDMTIWVPDRAQSSRVARIVSSPRTCGDRLVEIAEEIT